MNDEPHNQSPPTGNGQLQVVRGRNEKLLSINGGLFLVFAIELFLMGLVVWSFLFNVSSFAQADGNSDLIWGLFAVFAACWGSWALCLSYQASTKGNIAYAKTLLAITVGSGAVLIGILVLNIALQFVAHPLYMDVRPEFSSSKTEVAEPESSQSTGDAANGKKWFGMSCVSCHGKSGEGVPNAAPSLLTSEFRKKATDSEISLLIKNGRATSDPANKTGKVMPAKGGNPFLTDAKIADLVAFLKNLDSSSTNQSSSLVSSKLTPDDANGQSTKDQSPPEIVRQWTEDELSKIAINPTEESVATGMKAFVKATCNLCHIAAVRGQQLGPTLDQIVQKFPREQILKHVVKPSLEVNKDYQTYMFELFDGRQVSGFINRESDEEIELIQNLLKPDDVLTIPIDDIDARGKSKLSNMPTGLLDVLTKEEIAGLVAYIDVVGHQIAASNAPPLNKWVVPEIPSESLPSTLATSTTSVVASLGQTVQADSGDRFAASTSWLFISATGILAFHFLWVVGLGTVIVMQQEPSLMPSILYRLSLQTVLFWSIGIGWLILWFILFFVST